MSSQVQNLQLTDTDYVFVAYSDSVSEGEMIEVTVKQEPIVVSRVDGHVHAFEGICTHAYAELADGELEDHCVYCPLHFACFDIRDGSVVEGPADEPLTVYDVVEKDGSIWIKV